MITIQQKSYWVNSDWTDYFDVVQYHATDIADLKKQMDLENTEWTNEIVTENSDYEIQDVEWRFVMGEEEPENYDEMATKHMQYHMSKYEEVAN